MKKEKRGYVYLLYDQGDERVYKIGVTTGSIEKRIKSLQTGNSGELTLCKYFETDYPFFIEGHMHRKYSANNTSGEWFHLTDEEASNFIEECKKFEKIVSDMKDNPFFPKNIK